MKGNKKIVFNRYHKIPQFHKVVQAVNFKTAFTGMDADGQPVYDHSLKKPTIDFLGTVKLHGSHSGIIYTPESGIRGMKREAYTEIIDNKKVVVNNGLLPKNKLSVHFEFNAWLNQHKEYLTELMTNLWFKYCKIGQQITLFGEWAGKKIQKHVGISKLPKSFYAFDCKVRTIETKEDEWIAINHLNLDNTKNIFNIYDFPTYNISIDFENPRLSQNEIIEITNQVEKECPVSKQLGIENSVGEGVVWTGFYKGEKLVFKVKGKKHSASKIKTLAPIDPEKLKNKMEFVDYACTVNRIEQGIQETGASEKKDIPDLLKWVANDILTEEKASLNASSLIWKDVARECNNRIIQYFFKKIETV